MLNQAPKGWILAGSAPKNYSIGTDTEVVHKKGKSGWIDSPIESDMFGTLMQTFRPTAAILNKRIRLSAWIKTESVSKWAGLWMRVDGIHDTELGFDNMYERPIKGTTEWKKYVIVLDIPRTTEHIAFGILLVGKGKVWIDDIAFDEVGMDTPVTGVVPMVPKGPENLDFSEE